MSDSQRSLHAELIQSPSSLEKHADFLPMVLCTSLGPKVGQVRNGFTVFRWLSLMWFPTSQMSSSCPPPTPVLGLVSLNLESLLFNVFVKYTSRWKLELEASLL